MLKRLIAGFTTFCLFIVPIYQAQAAVYTATPVNAVFQVVESGGARTAVQVATGLVRANPWGAAISAGMAIYALSTMDGSNTETAHLRPKGQAEQVPSWTNNTPPSSSGVQTFYQNSANPIQSTYAAACATAAPSRETAIRANTGDSTYTCTASGNPCMVTCTNSSNNVNTVSSPVTTIQQCPAGYSLASNTCVISTPSQVQYPSDGKKSFYNDNGTIKPDPRDPDNLPTDTWDSTPTTSNLNGESTKGTISANPDGGLTIKTQTQYTTNNNTQVHEQTVVTDQNGTVINVYQTNYYGTITSPTTQTTPTTQNLPTDYAKEATTQQIKTALTETGDSSLNSEKSALDTANTAHITNLQNGSTGSHGWSWSWYPSIQTATCSPYTATIAARTWTLDWCPMIAKVKSLLAFIMYMTTGYYLFYLATRRPE